MSTTNNGAPYVVDNTIVPVIYEDILAWNTQV